MILAGDIGGTNTRLACFSRRKGKLTSVIERVFSSRDYDTFDQVLEEFVAEIPGAVQAACLGVAGVVSDGRCQATNLPWLVDERVLAARTGTDKVGLLNDLEATAFGISFLQPDDLQELQAGDEEPLGNRAVIAAGTGLGEAGIFWNGRAWQPFASEGGHADFAPRNELEIELLRFLIARHGHVSWERVLSGPGLVNLFQFFADRNPERIRSGIALEIQEQNPAAVISQAALDRRCELCVEALDLFVSLYGSEAGNLALKLMARGGLYIAGGIAPKILPALCQPGFLASMAKGRFQSLLKSIPIRVVTADQPALWGAAQFAKGLAGKRRSK